MYRSARNHLQQAGEGPIRHPRQGGILALRPEQELLEDRSQLVGDPPRRQPSRPDQPRLLLQGNREDESWYVDDGEGGLECQVVSVLPCAPTSFYGVLHRENVARPKRTDQLFRGMVPWADDGFFS